ncbi:ribonuclease H [Trifolium pratense]|uniref:Ribonuclease H n=1 Tax=Trifolium pratense TaxID=57577 RepID=A0A2K3PEM6_TRIPR|nr:ribonuclease H [Trifolium pratense]
MVFDIHVIHSIWMGRNDIRFNKSSITLHAAKTKILTAVTTSAPWLDGYSSSSLMEKQVLSNFQVTPKLRNAPQIKLVLRKTPSFGWIKANTDGSVLGNLAACGGLFRNHSSDHMGSYAQPLGTVSILHAELMAIILAIEFAAAHSWYNLLIESDSKVALSAFVNPDVVPWDLRNRWSNCSSLGLVIFHSHIYREGNICADRLASHGHTIVDALWWDSLPYFLRDLFLHDKLGMSCYRFD